MIVLIPIKPSDLLKGVAGQSYKFTKKYLESWKADVAPPPHIVEYDEAEKKIYILTMSRMCTSCTDAEWEEFIKNYGPLPT